MSEIPAGIEPPVPEIPPFDLSDIEEIKKKRTYTLVLKVKKTSSNLHKIICLDDNTNLNLSIKLVK